MKIFNLIFTLKSFAEILWDFKSYHLRPSLCWHMHNAWYTFWFIINFKTNTVKQFRPFSVHIYFWSDFHNFCILILSCRVISTEAFHIPSLFVQYISDRLFHCKEEFSNTHTKAALNSITYKITTSFHQKLNWSITQTS